MKHNKLLKLTAVIMLVAMASLFLFACAADEPEPEPVPPAEEEQKVTSADIRAEITKAIDNSFDFDNMKPVGFEYALTTSGKTLNVKGYLDTVNVSESKMYLDFVDGANTLFTLSADDEYMYFVGDGQNRRIRGLNIGDALKGATLPSTSDISGSLFGALPSIVIDMIYTKEEFKTTTNNGITTNTIYGSFAEIGSLLGDIVGGMSPELGKLISDFLGGIDTQLVANINADKKIDSIDLIFNTPDDNIKVTFDSSFGNMKPEISVPNKADTTFVESNLVNFAIEGKVDMTRTNGYIETVVTTYNYEIYADLDLFAMLRNAIVKENDTITFDPAKMFDIEKGSIYINLSHKCTGDDACGKIEPANGSILTLAFAPESFGSNDFFIALKPLSILPQGFLSDAIGLGDIAGIVEGLLSGYFGTNISPAALFAEIPSEDVDTMAMPNIPTNINIVEIVGKVLDVISEFRIDEVNGLRIGTDAIADLLYSLDGVIDVGNVNLPLAIKMLIGDATHMYIDVDRAEYGVPELETLKYDRMFMTIDESVGEYKFDEKRLGVAVDINFDRDINGDIVLLSKNVNNYDITTGENGEKIYKPLPMSKAEYEAMFAGKVTVPYSYTSIAGVKGRNEAIVKDIWNYDLDKTGKETINVVTSLADTGATGTVGGILNSLAFILDIKLPGQAFTTTINVSENPTFEFITNVIDKTYNYNDPLQKNANLVLTYGTGESAVKKTYANIAPVRGGELVERGKIIALGDFTLSYDKFGYKSDFAVKVARPEMTKDIVNDTIDTVTGRVNKISPTVKFQTALDGKMKNVNIIKEYNTTFVTPEGIEVVKVLKDNGNFDSFGVLFEKAGTYEITVNVQGGFSKKITYNVTESKATVELPKFTMTTKAKDGAINVVLGRENQLGNVDTLKGAILIKGVTNDENATLTELVFGTDYDIIVDNKPLTANELMLNSYQGIPEKFSIVIKKEGVKKDVANISIVAIEFDNAEIGNTSIGL